MKLPERALVLEPGTWSVLFTAGSLAPRAVSTTEWAHDKNVFNEGIKHENMSAERLWERLGNTILPFPPTQLNDYNNTSLDY